MSSRNVKLPKLFKRGKNKIFNIRRQIDGKDTFISLKTNDETEAKELAEKYIIAEISAKAEKAIGANAYDIAAKHTKQLTGVTIEKYTFAEGLQLLIDHTPDYEDLADTYKKSHEATCTQFSEWCCSKGITHMHQVDKSIALRYAKYYWDRGVTVATFNNQIKFLSRLFETVDRISNLPNRNPFHSKIVKRKEQPLISDATHQPFEPKEIDAIIKEAATRGQDLLDLFIIGSQCGFRLGDCCLLKWINIDNGYIEILPMKTEKTGKTARVPITPALYEVFRRRSQKVENEYILPAIAESYLSKSDWVQKQSQDIISQVISPDRMYIGPGKHRKKRSAVYAFHSFRTTICSLLAAKDASIRDVKRALGWVSDDMVRIYEKMLEKAHGEADARASEYFDSFDELKYEIPVVVIQLHPTKEHLEELILKYSNVVIGRIYGMSDVAINKHLKKHGIERVSRIISGKVTEEEIAQIRKELTDRLNSQ